VIKYSKGVELSIHLKHNKGLLNLFLTLENYSRQKNKILVFSYILGVGSNPVTPSQYFVSLDL